MMASWRTSCWCRQDAEKSPSTSTRSVQDLSLSHSELRSVSRPCFLFLLLRIVAFQWYSLQLPNISNCGIPHTVNRFCLSWLVLEERHSSKNLSVCIHHSSFSPSLSLCLSSSRICDDFTEPRNLKLSLGLQSASEKPINSSFHSECVRMPCVCMRGLAVTRFSIKAFQPDTLSWAPATVYSVWSLKVEKKKKNRCATESAASIYNYPGFWSLVGKNNWNHQTELESTTCLLHTLINDKLS